MGKVYEKIEPRQKEWISQQHLFFVSTAPLSGDGLVNLSPKGLDSFRILDDTTVAYLDLTGSGAETIAHLRENQRITIMFCAFDGPPKILRFYGKGEALVKGSEGFETLIDLFPEYLSTRAIIKIKVHRIADSCGYAIPLYDYKEDRDTLLQWADRKGPEGVLAYQKEKNSQSLDGLPALDQ